METISPLNYYYIAAAGGMRSSSFLGDIAIKYGMLRQMGYLNYPNPEQFQPNYKELNQYDFWVTVGVNEKVAFGKGASTAFMKNMTRNTMHGIDYNGSNKFPNAKEGSTMYKNFYFQQPIKPENKFYCFLLTREEFKLPDIIRMGTGKTGMVRIKRAKTKNFNAILNYYTLTNIIGLELPKKDLSFAEHLVLQYYLAGFFSNEELPYVYSKWSN